MVILYFMVTTALLVGAFNAVRPPMTRYSTGVRPAWFPAMLAAELAPTLIVILALLNASALWLGVFRTALGLVGLAMSGAVACAAMWMILLASRTGREMDRALGSSVKHGPVRDRLSFVTMMWPYPYRVPRDVVVRTDVAYTAGCHADIYRSSRSVTPAPVLVHIHGGSWSGGTRKQQARPLIHAMAQAGWVVVSIDYPLVPAATFPEPILAVHQAVGWIRRNAEELGIDPSSIVLTGGSSGAHLASLAGLTDDHTAWGSRRPEDPPIAAVVVFYGVFDLLNRHGTRDDWPIIERGLMKARKEAETQRYTEASPVDRVRADAPSFLIIHGRHDSLVPFAESVAFADALRAVSTQSVDLILLGGASHAFDAIPSLRTQLMVQRVRSYLDGVVGD